MLPKTKINHTDIEIARINLGGNTFGWTNTEEQSFAILDKFTAKGFNFIDTADMYSYWVDGKGGGQSESIIGNWMKQRNNRREVVIATKVGGASGIHPKDTSKKHILEAVDKSLQRLKTDYIDLYYTHYDDEVTPVEETMQAYAEIIKAGKVRYIAASNVSPNRLIESMEAAEKNGFPSYVALQPYYNLLVRDKFEKEYAPLVEKYGLSVFTYWSLESGFLTGKYRSAEDADKSPRGADVAKYFNDKGFAVLAALDKVAEKHGVAQASVSLAWLLAKPLVTAPIVSATNDNQLQALFAATEIVLDKEDLEILNEAGK